MEEFNINNFFPHDLTKEKLENLIYKNKFFIRFVKEDCSIRFIFFEEYLGDSGRNRLEIIIDHEEPPFFVHYYYKDKLEKIITLPEPYNGIFEDFFLNLKVNSKYNRILYKKIKKKYLLNKYL